MLEEEVMVNVSESFFLPREAQIVLMKTSHIDRKFVANSHFCIISNGKKGVKTASLRLVDTCVCMRACACVCIYNHLF